MDLVTLYRVVKHHPDEFVRYLRWILVAREEFERFKKEDPETLTDIQKAVRFYYLLRNGYASRIRNPTFSISAMEKSNFNLLRIEEELSAVHLRLARVYIENKHFAELIPRFDRPTLDPPYYGCEDYYGEGIFEREDFQKLRDIVTNLKGKFILSINDHPYIREIFKNFQIRKEQTTYLAASKTNKKVTELLVSNF